ncbi:unnamed protein product [Cochlearia groenlandica]
METIKIGPLGTQYYNGRTKWDDMGHNVISHIIVCFDENGLRSIRFGYVKNGSLVMSKTYGPVMGNTRILRLKHETEFVTGISGETYCGHITSLTFHTNQRKLEAIHLTFDSTVRFYEAPEKIELLSGIIERHEFGGFFGTHNNSYLSSIGLYVRLVLNDVKKEIRV